MLAAAFGLVLSAYAVYVEHKVATALHDDDATATIASSSSSSSFTALCDIEAIGASCSAVFALPQGRMLSYFGLVPVGSVLDLPNAALGMVHYVYLLLAIGMAQLRWQQTTNCATSKSRQRLAAAALPVTNCMVAAAFASTVFLAYQLTFVIYELCVLCWSTHAINTYMFYDQFFNNTAAGAGTAAAASDHDNGSGSTEPKKTS